MQVSGWLERLHELEGKRRKAIEQIKRRRNEIERLHAACRDLRSEVLTRILPIFEQAQVIERDIHALFAEIFQTRKLGKRSRSRVMRIYDALQASGVISSAMAELGDEEEDTDFPEAQGEPGPESFAAGGQAGEEAGGPRDWQMPRRDAGVEERARGLRETFLRLAARFHPDRAADAETQQRYTELMKELNRAYHEGDAETLLGFERDLADRQGGGPVATASDSEARCKKLEAEISMLEAQLRALTDDLADLQRSDIGQMIAERERMKRLMGGDLVAFWADEAGMLVETLTEIRDFVRRFRDREITIEAFVRGPDAFMAEADEDTEAIEDLLHAMASMALEMERDTKASPRRRRKKSARKA